MTGSKRPAFGGAWGGAPHLVEPLALLNGEPAADAIAAGLALPFMGGPGAFSLARLHAPGGPPRLVRAPEIPPLWRDALARVIAAPPAAGLPGGTLLMAILNATPDSFSDPGLHADPVRAVAAGLAFRSAGADILDIGGESTRPGAEAPPVAEELRRVLPLLDGLRDSGAVLSVDTRRAPVMEAALAAGAHVINDVSALAFDPDAASLLARASCPVVLMHMRGTPATMRDHAHYDDVAVAVVRELGARVDAAVAAGIDRTRIVIDPGIGFAKNPAQSVALLRRLPILANLGARIVLGVSRKSFIGRVANDPPPRDRLPGSLAALAAARGFPGPILRVHDVAATAQWRLVNECFA